MTLRHYNNTSPAQVLAQEIDKDDTVLTVNSTAGYPPVPFTIGIERGTAREEVCLVTDKDETSFTVQRGFDGTMALPHDIGSLIEHTVVAIDYRESVISPATQAERDALSGEHVWDGKVLFNTDSKRLEVKQAGGWDQILPTGAVVPFGGSTVPAGFLLCNGQAVSRETYAGLFTVIGTTYGAGDGSTTFEVPDLRQRFPLGKSTSGTGSVLGEAGGAIDHTHTQPTHTHSGPSHTHSNPNTSSAGSHAHSQGNTGSGGSHSHGAGTMATGGSNNNGTVSSSGGSVRPLANHTHNITGTTTSAGSHSHSNPNTASGGSHSHTQGSTGASGTGQTGASGGDTTGSANPPYLTVNYLIRV